MGAVGIVTAAFPGQPLWHFCSDRVQCDTGGGRGGIRAGDRPTDLGAYRGLDALIKAIAGVLLVSTIVAFWSATRHTALADVPPARRFQSL